MVCLTGTIGKTSRQDDCQYGNDEVLSIVSFYCHIHIKYREHRSLATLVVNTTLTETVKNVDHIHLLFFL